MSNYDELENVLIVPTEMESTEEIIEDYVDSLIHYRDRESIRITLDMFYEEIAERMAKDIHIQNALNSIQALKQIERGDYLDDE